MAISLELLQNQRSSFHPSVSFYGIFVTKILLNLHFFIGLDLPIPQNVSIAESTNSTITLTWDYPPPPSVPINGFQVSRMEQNQLELLLILKFLFLRLHILRASSGPALNKRW